MVVVVAVAVAVAVVVVVVVVVVVARICERKGCITPVGQGKAQKVNRW